MDPNQVLSDVTAVSYAPCNLNTQILVILNWATTTVKFKSNLSEHNFEETVEPSE